MRTGCVSAAPRLSLLDTVSARPRNPPDCLPTPLIILEIPVASAQSVRTGLVVTNGSDTISSALPVVPTTVSDTVTGTCPDQYLDV